MYFERALFCPATDQFFKARTKALFEPPGGDSSIDVYTQPLLQVRAPYGTQRSDDEVSFHSDDETEFGSKQDYTPVTEPSSPTCWRNEEFPRCEKSPRLPMQKVSNSEHLRDIERVRFSKTIMELEPDSIQSQGFKRPHSNLVRMTLNFNRVLTTDIWL